MINFIDETGKQHSAIVECKKTKGVNGEKSLSGTIHTNNEILEGIGRGWRLQFEGENYCLTYVNPIDEGTRSVVEFDAVHEFFFDMQKSVIYSEMNGSNTASAYLRFIFDGSGYEYRLEVTIPAFEKENFGMKNRLDLFKDFISSTGAEFSVNGKIVRILEKVGSNLSTIVKKGFNLNELRIEKDSGSFITYLKGYGAFVDPEDESQGRLIVEYLSPLAEVYGKLEGDPIIDERYTVANSFIARLKNDVENSYGISVDIDMEDLTQAGYEYDQPHEGDYIMAINKDLGFEQKIRIMSYTTSYDTEGNIIDHDVSCGSDNIIQKKINEDDEFRKEVQAGLENAVSTANQAWVSADDKNKIFQGPDRPTATNKGDIWYQIDGEETIMNYWDGYDWVPFINPNAIDREMEVVKETAANAQEKADEAKAIGDIAQEKADEAKVVGQQAKELSEESKVNADNALTASADAVAKATAAANKANSSEAIAEEAKEKAEDALNSNEAIVVKIDDINGSIEIISQKTEDQGVIIHTLESNYEEFSNTIAKVEIDLENKATVTQFSDLTQTVDSLQGTVASKAEQTQVTQLAGQITSLAENAEGQSSQITQLASQLNFEITNSDGSVTQIDLANKTITLSGEQINITGNTFIDNSVIKTANIADLAVTNAKIASLSADKLTAGEIDANIITVKNINASYIVTGIIDASKVTVENLSANSITTGTISANRISGGTIDGNEINVINLNASNITTGTISGENLTINLATGEVIFNKGIIKNLDDTFQMNITTGVTASRGEYLSPNNTGDTLAAGYNLMNGKIEFYAGTFGEASVSYGGLTTETHSGQYQENGIWQAGIWSGSLPAIALRMANPDVNVWQSRNRAVLLSSSDYQEPYTLNNLWSPLWLGYGDVSGAVTKQNIVGGGIGVAQRGSYLDEAKMPKTEAWMIARHGVFLGSGYNYESTVNGGRKLTPSLVLGRNVIVSGSTDYEKQIAATSTLTAGYAVELLAKNILLWVGSTGDLRVQGMRTASGSANLVMDGSGNIKKVSSARKYKTAIEHLDTIDQKAKRILEIRPAKWVDKEALKNYNDDSNYYGFIADEFHELGLTEVVQYNDKGEVESLAYDRLSIYIIPLIQSLKNEVDQLKNKLKELEAA
nr:MAG TPA: tail protein [Caudoviricetes sp.]